MANEEHLKILKQGVKVWNEWRKENRYITPDLCNADFYNAQLSKVDLSKASLSSTNLLDADLSNANLFNVNLHNAQLSNTNLSNADLIKTQLSNTDLSNANLSGVNLSGANLSYTDILNTDLSQIQLNYTTLSNIDLSSIKNINDMTSIQHSGPSTISTSTLKQSKGKIPEIFLKGCGLDDWEIESAKLYRPGLTPEQINNITYKIYDLRENNPFKFFPVFLSHSHQNKDFTSKLYHALDKRGVRAWFDEKQIKIGDRIDKAIHQGIHYYDKFVLICSKDAFNSWWVDHELRTLLEKERKFNDRKPENERVQLIIPITINDYIFNTWESSMKSRLLDHKVGDFRNFQEDKIKFNQQVDQIVEALKVYPKDNLPPTYFGK